MRKKNSPVTFVLVGVILAVVVALNIIAQNSRPKTEAELQAEQQAQAARSTPDTKKTMPSPAPPTASTPADDLTSLDADTTIGKGTGAPTVTLGWKWTPDVQADPSLVGKAVEALKNAGAARVRVVNTDAVAGVPDGLSVNGNVVVPLGENGSLNEKAVLESVQGAEKPKP